MGKWDEEFDKVLAETLANNSNSGTVSPFAPKLPTARPTNYMQTKSLVNNGYIAPVTPKTTVGTVSTKKKKKWYESGLFEDGYDFGDVTKTILGVNDESASIKDLTVNSFKRGYYNSVYGEESYDAMLGRKNNKDAYKNLLESEEYQFAPGNDFAGGVSGAFELLGQQYRQFTNPRTMAYVGTAVTGAILAGNAGPQALAPEEIVTVPAAAAFGFTTGSSQANLEIEAGHAYNELIESGISEETARKIATGVGSVNAGLEALQVDELVGAFKVLDKTGATDTVAKKILKELVERGVDVAKETGQEVLQEGVTIGGVQLASKLDKGELAYTKDEVANRLLDTAKSSALSFGMMNVPASVKNTASIISDQKKANLTQTEHPVAESLVDEKSVIPTPEQEVTPAEVKPVVQELPVTEAKPNVEIEQTIANENGTPLQDVASNTDVLFKNRKDGWGEVYATAQEALNDAVKNSDSELWDAFNAELENTPQNTQLENGSTPIINALIAVQEDVRQETITPMQGARLLSEMYKQGGTEALKQIVNPVNGNLHPQFIEQAKQYESVAPAIETTPDSTQQQETQLAEENSTVSETENVADADSSADYETVSSMLGKLMEQDVTDSKNDYQEFSIDGFLVERFRKGDHYEYSVTLPDGSSVRGQTALDKSAFYGDLANKIMTKPQYRKPGTSADSISSATQATPTEQNSEPVAQKPLTTEEKAQKHYRDTLIDFDKLEVEDNIDNRKKYDAIVKATELAQNFISKGTDGVKSISEIFGKISTDGNLGDFEKYVYHLLNTDRASLDTRFGMENKYVFGKEVTAKDSQKEVDRLEAEHPEFKKVLEDVYAFNQYLLNMQVQSGEITQEFADRLNEMYPHYAPISRSRWGDKQISAILLDFITDNPANNTDNESLDKFLGDIEENKPMQSITSEGYDFNPLIDTMVDRALRTYWTVAMKQAGLDPAIAPMPDTTANVAPDPFLEEVEQESTHAAEPENVEVEVEEYVSKSSEERREDLVREKGLLGKAISFVQEYIVDNGYEFEKVAKKANNRKLEATWNQIRNANAIAQHIIGNGDNAKGVRALTDIIDEVSKSGLTSEFYSYLGHQRNIDGMTMRSRYGIAANRNFMGRDVTAGKSWQEVRKLESEHPEFKEWAKDCYAYADYYVNKFVERGMLSKEDAELWKELYPHFVPMRTANGSAHMFETLAQFTIEAENALAMNDFGLELENTLHTEVDREFLNIDSFISRIDSGDSLFTFGENGDHKTLTVYQNGERTTFDINDEMYMALKPTADWLNWKIPVLSHASEFFRKATTEYNIWFALKNAVRDPQDIIYNSQHPMETYAHLAEAEKEVWTKGEWYQEYVANGGNQVDYFDLSDKSFSSDHVVKEALKKYSGLNFVGAVNNRVETAPRLAEYIASRKAGKSVAEAMLDSARVTTNFAAGGKFTKFLNRNGCTFLNASVQGALQHSRNWREATMNGFKGWATMAARYVATGLTASMLNKLFWEDDEEYEKLPDYISDNYYVLPQFLFPWLEDDQFVRLPKGRTNVVIENAIKQVAKQSKGDDEADWDAFWKLMVENLAPNNPLEDNIFAPLVQTATNTTWYDEDIVPYRLKDLPKSEQYDEKTDALSIKLGEMFDASPKKINYLLNQYTGIIGDTLLPLSTPKAESPSDSLGGKLLAPLRDIFTTDSTLNNRVTGDFYETLEEAEAKAESPDATPEDKFLSSYLISTNAEVSKLMQQQRDIQTSDRPDSEKYQLNKELKKQINDLQKKALEGMDSLHIEGNYAEAGGKRFNLGTDSETKGERWFEIKPKKADGTDNKFYLKEQAVTHSFGVSYEKYWNNKEAYDDAFYIASGYDNEDGGEGSIMETVKNVFGVDKFASFAGGLADIKSDYDDDGNAIKGSRKKKLNEFISGLDISDIEKHILYKTQYNWDNSHNYEILDYLNGRNDIDFADKLTICEELGFTVGKDGRISWD